MSWVTERLSLSRKSERFLLELPLRISLHQDTRTNFAHHLPVLTLLPNEFTKIKVPDYSNARVRFTFVQTNWAFTANDFMSSQCT
jgi:hypothetical protein